MKAKNPSWGISEIGKELGGKWKALSDKEKEVRIFACVCATSYNAKSELLSLKIYNSVVPCFTRVRGAKDCSLQLPTLAKTLLSIGRSALRWIGLHNFGASIKTTFLESGFKHPVMCVLLQPYTAQAAKDKERAVREAAA